MGSRLNRIATGTGDNGTTSIGGQDRTGKGDLIVEVIGVLDEVNVSVGRCNRKGELDWIQNDLFYAGAYFCGGDLTKLNDKMGEALVKINTSAQVLTEPLPPLTDFVLPKDAIDEHQARVDIRRAERTVCRWLENTTDRHTAFSVELFLLPYLNRLSDFFFSLARLRSPPTNDDFTWDIKETSKSGDTK